MRRLTLVVSLFAACAMHIRAVADGPDSPPPAKRGGKIVGILRRGGLPSAGRVEARRCASVRPAPGESVEFFDELRRLDGVVAAPVAAAKAGSDGAYTLAGLEPGNYEVAAFLEDGSAVMAKRDVVAAGVRVALDLTVPLGGSTLRGRAKRADGTAFRGWIAVCPFTPVDEHFTLKWERVGVPVETAADGSFSLRDLPAGQVFLAAIAPPGFLRLGGIMMLPAIAETVFDVDVHAGPISGRVLQAEDGRPIADAAVVVQAGTMGKSVSWTETRTGPDGGFRALCPAAGDPDAVISVVATAAGRRKATVASRSATTTPAGIVVKLPRLGRIGGRAVTLDGKPAAGARACAWPLSMHDERWSGPPITTTTQADGRFVLDGIPTGLEGVVVWGAGWVSRDFVLDLRDPIGPFRVLVGGAVPAEIERVVVPDGRLRVHVTDAGGTPLPEAAVRVREDPNLYRPQRLPPLIDAATGAATLEDGAFTIAGLVPDGLYRVVVEAVGRPRFETESMRVASGETRAVEIRLQSPRSVRVRVTQARDGSPVPGARVDVAMDRAAWEPEGPPAWTGSDGIATISGPSDGIIAVRAEAPGLRPATLTRAVPASSTPVAEWTIDLPLETGLTLAGRVVLAPALPAGTPVHLWLSTPRHSRLAVVGSDGRFQTS